MHPGVESLKAFLGDDDDFDYENYDDHVNNGDVE